MTRCFYMFLIFWKTRTFRHSRSWSFWQKKLSEEEDRVEVIRLLLRDKQLSKLQLLQLGHIRLWEFLLWISAISVSSRLKLELLYHIFTPCKIGKNYRRRCKPPTSVRRCWCSKRGTMSRSTVMSRLKKWSQGVMKDARYDENLWYMLHVLQMLNTWCLHMHEFFRCSVRSLCEAKFLSSTAVFCNCVSEENSNAPAPEAKIELTQDVEDMGNWASGQLGEWNVEKT